MSRLARHAAVSAALAGSGDAELARLAGATTIGEFGGGTGVTTVGGVPVFVKRLPLTERELARPHDTANLFALPAFYHYGVGSAGLGAWRELAAHTLTTAWVREGRFAGFPLLYHARVLPRTPTPADPSTIEQWTAFWANHSTVRERLTEMAGATSALTLFLEYVPHTLADWLRRHPDYDWADRSLREATAFTAANGLIHFDAHFGNVLTDGERLYLADFGLALHDGFALSPAERDFHRAHRDYDRRYTAARLTHWLLAEHLGLGWRDVPRWLAAHPAGDGLPPRAAAIVARDRAVTVAITELLSGIPSHTPGTPA